MTLAAGARLGPYEVISPLGAGGMGEVWRARDTRLSREVAVKVLPAEVASEPSRLRRFETEARSASSLNHPSIVTIYEIGQEGSVSYIAMELVEGKTLRELVSAGSLPIKKLLQIGTQVAEGLARAHEAGIVHRDLKPENIMVTKDGLVKILDFGLAKLTHGGPGSGGETNLPTQTATTPGVVMGTVGYMSPEQASGQLIDFRSDQFSLGSILYETATGQRAFQKGTAVDTLSAILHEDPPPIAERNTLAPAPLRWIVERCLAKDPEDRYSSTRDLARELATVRDHLSEASLSGALPAARRGWRFSPAAAISALVGAAILAFLAGSRARLSWRAGGEPPSFHQLTFRRGSISSARFAPDGQTIVYSGAWDGLPARLFMVRAGSTQSSPLSLPDADVLSVSRSGELALSLRWDYVFGVAAAGVLARVPLDGSAPREILEGVQEADWSPDGSALAVIRRVQGRHRLEYPAGKVLYTTSGWVSHPRFSPDASRIAFFDHPNYGDNGGSVAVLDLNGRKTTLSEGWTSEDGLAWAPAGNEVWFTAAAPGSNRHALYAVKLSGRRRVILRAPASLTLYDVFRDGRTLLSSDVIRFGILAVSPGQAREHDLSWQDVSYAVDLSADGKDVLISDQGEGPDYGVYLRATDGSPAVRLGDGQAFALSPDKKWALALALKEPQELLLLPTGAGEPRHIKRGPIRSYGYYGSWFPDGRRIQFSGREQGAGTRLYVQPIDGDPRPISPEGIQPPVAGHALSSDGRFVLARDSEGKGWLYPVEGGDPRPLPGLRPGENPVGWSADGRALFVMRTTAIPALVYRLDLASQKETLWKDLTPTDAAGLDYIAASLALDGAAYVCSYTRLLGDLHLVDGLK